MSLVITFNLIACICVAGIQLRTFLFVFFVLERCHSTSLNLDCYATCNGSARNNKQ